MLTMDVFEQNGFRAVDTIQAIDKVNYIPTYLDDLGIFSPEPVQTEDVVVEERSTQAALIQTSARGAPPRQTGGERRKLYKFETVRLADSSRITSAQLQGVRAFGSFTEVQSLQIEIARRQQRILNNFALTKENLRLSCVMGAVVKDADGSEIIDWGDVLSNPVPPEIAVDFSGDGSEGQIRQQLTQIRRGVKRSLVMGQASDQVRCVAITGDNFFDRLTNSKETRQTYQNWAAAADLRQALDFETFPYGGVLFANYRGTDDGDSDSAGTVGVEPNDAWVFPNAGPGGSSIFKWAMSPGESFADVNTKGKDSYSLIVRDPFRDQWADIEVYSYPLPVCTLPSALRHLTIA